MRLVHSSLLLHCAAYIEYTSTLETFEFFSSSLARHCTHQYGAWVILYPIAKVTESQELLMVVNKAPSSLLVDS